MISKTETNQIYPSIHNRKLQKTPFFDVLIAAFKKDLLVAFRYKQEFASQFIRTLVFILIFWMFGLSFSFDDLLHSDVTSVFIFYIASMTLLMYDGVALWGPYESVRNDLYNGTLEAVYQNPSSRYGYYLGGILARSVYSSVFVIPMYLTLIFIAQPNFVDISMILVTIIAALATLVSMGMIVGLTAILWKDVGALINILGLVMQFLTGAIIPLTSLPDYVRWIGYIFPTTWGLDIIRYYTFSGEWLLLAPLYIEWMILGILFLLYTGFSVILLKRVEDHSKKEGLHLI